MRSYETVLMQAEWLASPPEVVAAKLREQAETRKLGRLGDDYDEEFEKALLGRGDPLINLALARYGFYQNTVYEMFRASPPEDPIRLACLSNKNLQGQLFARFPVALFGSDAEMLKWLANMSPMEAYALFENPTIDEGWLRDLLDRDERKPWATVSDDALGVIVSILARNPRMWTSYDDSYLDGYSEYMHNAVFGAAWELAGKVETSDRWANALSTLYQRLLPSYGVKEPLKIAGRWLIDPANSDAIKAEAESVGQGYLSSHQGVRKGLARLALREDPKRAAELLGSPDPAIRSAIYSWGPMTPEAMDAAFAKDGELAFNEALRNENLWKTTDGRAALSRAAWGVVNADDHSDMLPVNIYKNVERDMAAKHPEWFVGDDDYERPDLDQSPATKADIQALGAKMEGGSVAEAFIQLRKAVADVYSRLGWVWWFALAAALLGLKTL